MKKVLRSSAVNNQLAVADTESKPPATAIHQNPITATFVVFHDRDHLFDYSVPITNRGLHRSISRALHVPMYRLRFYFPEYRDSVGLIVIIHRNPLKGRPVIATSPELRNLVEELTEAVNRVEFNWKQEEDMRRWLQEAIDHPYDGYWEAEADRLGYES